MDCFSLDIFEKNQWIQTFLSLMIKNSGRLFILRPKHISFQSDKAKLTGNDNVLKLECEIKDISVYELCIQMLNVLIHFLRKVKDEIPPRIKFPMIND